MTRKYQSYSSLSTYARCPRLYKYKYVDGYEEIDVPLELAYGTAWHGAMASLNNGGTVTDAVAAAQATGVVLGKQWWNQISAALPVYVDEYFWQLKEYKPILVESEATVAQDGLVFKVVFDAIIEDPDGVLAILEHKTTTSKDLGPESKYWERRAIDHQTQLYLWAARRLGYQAEYVIYDVTRRCLQRQCRGESYHDLDARVAEYIRRNPSEVFCRRIIQPKLDEIDATVSDLMSWATMAEQGRFPRCPNACLDFGRTCLYRPVCLGECKVEELNGIRLAK